MDILYLFSNNFNQDRLDLMASYVFSMLDIATDISTFFNLYIFNSYVYLYIYIWRSILFIYIYIYIHMYIETIIHYHYH
jgi:hypothetical protein